MRIKSIRVENFRSVRSATLELDDLTALVGANGAGKSTFLRALLVFQGRQEPDEEDFYNRDTAKSIEIAVTFTGLPGEARKKFARYIKGGELEVVRVCGYNFNTGTAESSLRGTCRRNPAFDAVRKAHDSVDALDEYDRLCGRPESTPSPSARRARPQGKRWTSGRTPTRAGASALPTTAGASSGSTRPPPGTSAGSSRYCTYRPRARPRGEGGPGRTASWGP